MNSHHLQVIRQKTIEANPEIVELEFGCEVKSKAGWLKIITPKFTFNPHQGTYRAIALLFEEMGHREYAISEEDIYEIIGRPIRLADVLLAMQMENVPGFYINRFGKFEAKGDYENGAAWNCYKDDLSLQSEECLTFIYNLLK